MVFLVNAHVGDYGYPLVINTVKDISDATAAVIHYVKPNNARGTWTGTIYNASTVTYDYKRGDLDVAGDWKLQVAFSNGTKGFHTIIGVLHVGPIIT